MSNENSFYLIKGEFSPEEAREVLLSLFSFKIQFHENKLLSDRIRGIDNEEKSLNRLRDLRASKNKIQELLSQYSDLNSQLQIEAEVQFSLVVKEVKV